ncbi:copper transport protein [Isoptericola sp. CG 20/1183]|uniref:Copper transport protein n=1 Tax=Isoptericola halotolerans TaxID=300560 RepID=A0ABX5ECU0_9MICO|nr:MULTISPECIES: CopD family protein [Isoptericola]PRZ02678.1 copper transport protein [Isoptericola sp. CG 20/1183]PRZ03030.1 copper transport protein [Isoptericola halotolerans]
MLKKVAVVLFTVALVLVGAPSASAHTDLDTAEPADGTTTSGPVGEVLLTFTRPVTPLGDTVVVEGPDGTVDVDVTQERAGAVVVATPEGGLADGGYEVAWSVAAQDGHPLEGTFSFTVQGTQTAPSEAPEPTVTQEASSPAEPSGAPLPPPDLERTTDPGAEDFAQVVARLGNAAALWGLLVGAGGLLFAALVMRGPDRRDIPVVLRAVRWTGLLVLVGLAVRVTARAVVVAGGDVAAAGSAAALGDALAGPTAWVFGLQAVGAALVLVGAWRSLPGSWAAVVGVLAMTAGQVLGGHSNTGSPWWLVVGVDVAHLAAAATWTGGVVMIGVVLRRRRKDGRALDAGHLGSRFSSVAALSVVVVGIAGILLAVEILDRPSQLWESSWGLFLLAKVAVVAVVAAIGAHQHFRVVPSLQAPGHGARRAHAAGSLLQRGAGHETALLVVVVLITAWLVAASVHA